VKQNRVWIFVALSATAALSLLLGASPPPNLNKALETQLELYRQRPTDAKVANDLGNLLVWGNRSEEAEAAYRRAIELTPSEPVPRYNLALLLQQQNQPRAALKELEEVVKLDPANAWAHYQTGALHEALGHSGRAIRAYAEAFRLNPNLASEKVNPQILDSQLVFEAMVDAYKNPIVDSLAPKAYEDPQRIARLLVATPASDRLAEEGSEGQPGTVESKGEGSPVQAATSADSSADQSAEGGNEAGRQVLSSETVEGRSTTRGQVLSSGATVAPERSSGGRDSRISSPTGSPTANPSGRTPGESQTRPGRVVYPPSTRSTGSLDLELRRPDPSLPFPA
jgi:hypothetical protein